MVATEIRTLSQSSKETALEIVKLKVDASRFGIPVSIANHPLFDHENKDEIVATLGIIMPKKTAATLRTMSNTLEDGLKGISAAIQQLAASATEEITASIEEITVMTTEFGRIALDILM